ncbi:MAG: WecB/TagA/CpsF family glycosyltransferase [Mucilaginibacter sp.]
MENVILQRYFDEMNNCETVQIFDYSLYISKLDEINVSSKCVINTLNQYSYTVAEKDHKFKTALIESDILLPDGIGIVGAVKLLKGITIKKIAGSDLHEHLLYQLSATGGRCFYLGSNEATLINIQKHLAIDYPSIKMGFYSPPFKSTFSEDDNAVMIKNINSFKPDVLFVGMTAPKQEKWVHEHKDKVDSIVICSIGAVFEFYAGNIKRPGQIWIDLGLEWFVRLLHEPRHTWKRYIYYGPIFVYRILKQKIINIFK